MTVRNIALLYVLIGIIQLMVCVVGFFANLVCIPVLRSKDMYNSTFNRLLIVLVVSDNLYLTFAFFECLRTDIGVTNEFHTQMFVYALYPSHNIMLCVSIYLTVALSMERYFAVNKPIGK